jgi:hypothetical protein
MLLSRGWFFAWLFVILPGPFVLWKIGWLAGTKRTEGKVYFTGHHFDPLGGVAAHMNVIFCLGGRDSVEFINVINLQLPDDTPVPVRYRTDNPLDARVDTFICIWGDTLVWILLPLMVWLVLLLTPNRFDPLIPWGCRVQLRWRWPWIRVITPVALGHAAHRPVFDKIGL